MRSREALEAPEALALTMVLVAAADGGMSDREIGVMAGQVQTLPVFRDFTTEQFRIVTDAAVRLLNEEDGLQHAARLMRSALEPRLRETAYALACEVVAANPVDAAADARDAGIRSQRTSPGPAGRDGDRTRRPRPAPACGARRRKRRGLASPSLPVAARDARAWGGGGDRRGSGGGTADAGWRAGPPSGRHLLASASDAAGGTRAGAVLVTRSRRAGRDAAPGRRRRADWPATVRETMSCRACSGSGARGGAAGATRGGADGAGGAVPPHGWHRRGAVAGSADRAGGRSQRAPRQFRGPDGVRRRHAGRAAPSGPARRDRPGIRFRRDRDGRGDPACAGAARGPRDGGADGPADGGRRPGGGRPVGPLARARGGAHARRFRRQCQP